MGKLKIEPIEIDKAFVKVVDAVSTTMREKGLKNPVDLQIEFKEMGVNKKGFIVFSKTNQSQMSITLATRIAPEDLDDTDKQ